MKAIRHLNKRQKIGLCILVVIVYVGSYTILSVCGEYQISMSGENRYYGGIAFMDMYKWIPYGIVCEVYRGVSGREEIRGLNLLGALYSPLVWLDRRYIHKNKYISELDRNTSPAEGRDKEKANVASVLTVSKNKENGNG